MPTHFVCVLTCVSGHAVASAIFGVTFALALFFAFLMADVMGWTQVGLILATSGLLQALLPGSAFVFYMAFKGVRREYHMKNLLGVV